MAKRYYICRRIGAGTEDNHYNSELRQYIMDNHPSEPHFTQQVITHTIPWVLMCYDLSDGAHNDVMANVSQAFSFPAIALNAQMSDIPVDTRNNIQTKLESVGFEFSWASGATTLREIFEYISHSIQLSVWCDTQISAQNFDINKTVSTITATKRQKLQQHLNDLGIDTSWITGATTIKEIADKVQTEKQYLYMDNE